MSAEVGVNIEAVSRIVNPRSAVVEVHLQIAIFVCQDRLAGKDLGDILSLLESCAGRIQDDFGLLVAVGVCAQIRQDADDLIPDEAFAQGKDMGAVIDRIRDEGEIVVAWFAGCCELRPIECSI